ncbi:MAG: hypothetical protein NTX53_13485 [candidate division WOR-3 bacterium]|nr:hypothetical protein [candidate division WOR-3 bacterium]
MSVRKYSACLVLLVATFADASAATFEFNGRASGWLVASWDTSFVGQAGLRYLPEARFTVPICRQVAVDADASVNGFASAGTRSFDSTDFEAQVKPYRATVRLSSPRFEARAGLQKINFGSAMLLRPLMWFDRVDPRDPLELTDGVYGLLARYYFQNNINIWGWGLLGNSSPKGWEVYGSERWNLEPGARVQFPVPLGEVAASYHCRRFTSRTITPEPAVYAVNEDRLGIDGKWDVGVGVLFEATMGRQVDEARWDTMWQRMATFGLDYTFGIGSGLGVIAEHMLVGAADRPFGSGQNVQLSALMLSFPMGLLDNLRGMVYYDWNNEDPYSYLGWQRTLDNWIFSVGAFWNPDQPAAAAGRPVAGAAGKGVRVEVVFNH